MDENSKTGTILVVNGPSSSGKTSLVRALQDQLEEPYLEAGIDKFVWMLPRRYLNRPLWDEVLGLAVEPGAYGRRLFSGMHQAIAALSRAGVNVIADHVLVVPEWVSECAGLFASLPAYLVGIDCPLEELERREQMRKDRTLGQARAQLGLIHAHRHYDCWVDTSRFSPDECALQVVATIKSGNPPQAFQTLREEGY